MKYILYGQNIPVITEEELYLQSLVMWLLSFIPWPMACIEYRLLENQR